MCQHAQLLLTAVCVHRRRVLLTLLSRREMHFARRLPRWPVLRRQRRAGLAQSSCSLACTDACAPSQVLIERVRSPAVVARETRGTPALEVSFQVHFAGDKRLCEQFVASCRVHPALVLDQGGIASNSSLAAPDVDSATFVLEEVTQSSEPPGVAAAASARQPSSERSVVPARPLKSMELPYKSYRVRPSTSSTQFARPV